jgi:hypothetical protein
MIRLLHIAPLTVGLALSACSSSAPSRQLIDARRAYEHARQGPAARHAPGELLVARRALDHAEHAHRRDSGSAREVHLAYVAVRSAQVAVVSAHTVKASQAERRAMSEHLRNHEGLERLERDLDPLAPEH